MKPSDKEEALRLTNKLIAIDLDWPGIMESIDFLRHLAQEPDWKAEYIEAVRLHNLTLDDLGAAERKLAAQEHDDNGEPVAVDVVISAINSVDREARRRGEMYPQTRDEQNAATKEANNVVERLRWYEKNTGCANIKGWPLCPHPEHKEPMTSDQIQSMIERNHFDKNYVLKGSDELLLSWYRVGIRDCEAHYGIGEQK
jgi:hypothetical protein